MKDLEEQLAKKKGSDSLDAGEQREGVSEIAQHLMKSIVGGKTVTPPFDQFRQYSQSIDDNGPHDGPFNESVYRQT